MNTKALLLFLVACTGVSGAAADFGGKKYYVNPGHGGHDSDDRPTPLPLGVPMFYESDGTLTRGLFVRDFLTANNAQVKMSRTTNTSADDLGLSTIAAQSNSYGGYFMSLHTNGANASANYIVTFFRTSSAAPTTETVAGSKAMAEAVTKWHDTNHLTNMTYNTARALGDYSFYGYNLGVLRTNNRPGYLVETVFHDYRPDGLRLKSDAYNRYTAWQIVRGALEKSGSTAGATGTLPGCIVGDIRDLSKPCGYTNYAARGRDQYLAINGATVNLYNSAGTKVQSMTTDQCCNGVYAFFDLAAGTYKVEVVKSGYATQQKTVTVTANNSVRQLFDLTAGVSTGLTTSTASVDCGTVTLGSTATKTFTVTGAGLTAAIAVSCDNAAFTVSPASLAAAGGTVTVKYNPAAAGTHRGTITLKSGDKTATVVVSGSAVNAPLTFTEGWNYSEKSGNKPAWLTGAWGTLRNMCAGDGKLYIVSPSTNEVFIVNAQTCQLLGKLNTASLSEGTFKVMDIKYRNGKVIACNLAANAAEPIKVYVWDNDTAEPRCILNTVNRGSCARIGDTFDVDGDLTNGRLLFSFGGSDAVDACAISYPIVNGVVSDSPQMRNITLDDGSRIKLGTSPRAVAESGDRYWVMGQSYAPTLAQENGQAIATLNLAALDNVVQGNDFTRFSFKGTDYGFATTYTAPASAGNVSLTGGKMVLLDGTDGWAQCTQIGKYPNAGLGTTRNTNFSTSVCVNVNGDKGVEAWVLVSNQGIAYYKHGNVTPATPDKPTVTSTMANTEYAKTAVGSSSARQFAVMGNNLTADITLALSGTDAAQFRLSTARIAKASGSGNVTVEYVPKGYSQSHTATLTVSTDGAAPLTYTLRGSAAYLNDAITDPVKVWEYANGGASRAGEAAWWANTGNYTRAMAVAAGRMYVLGSGTTTATLHAMDAYSATDHAAPATVSVDGITGGTRILGYIAALPQTTAGTERLYGCNVATAAQPLKVYRWNNATSAPELILTDDTHGGIRVGDMMGVWGNEQDGRLMFSDGTKIVSYTIKNGAVDPTPQVVTLAKSLGGNASCNEVAYNADGTYWLVTKDNVPTRIAADGTAVESLSKTVLGGDSYGTAAKPFSFGTRRYMAATSHLNKAATTLADGVMRIIDITDGVANARCVATFPADGLGATRNTTFVNTAAAVPSADGFSVNMFVMMPMQGAALYRFNGESKQSTGVENIVPDAADTATAPDGLYDLRGIRVDPATAAPGLYIQRRAGRATRILIK